MILVTGAAGKTGLAVLHALHSRGLTARALIHREEYGKLALDAGAQDLVIADLRDLQSFTQAMEDTSALYLILPNMFQGEFELGRQLIDAAGNAGLKHVIYHSVLLPKIEAMPHHWDKHLLEQHLAASGLDFTVLQPASYMQNILGYWSSIKEHGVYKVPYSVDARFNPVDLQDIAEAAATVLAEKTHSGATYQLYGPETLSSADMAVQIADRLGRDVVAERQPLDEWEARARLQGLTPYALQALSAMFAYYDEHGFAGSGEDLDKLLGRPPTTFADFMARLN